MNLPNHQIAGLSERAGWAQSRVLVLLAVGYQWFYNGANFVAFKVGGDARAFTSSWTISCMG